jgi:polyphosphate kinase
MTTPTDVAQDTPAASRPSRAGGAVAKAAPPASPAVAVPATDIHAPYLNRELSWLEFNQRVLEEAANPRHPLLERVRFLSISASNMDEFFIVRVAGLKAQIRAGIKALSDDGLTPAEQLAAILERVTALMRDQQAQWMALRSELRGAGLAVLDSSELSTADLDWLADRFMADIYPILTPLAVDPAHPFPFIPNRGFGLALQLHDVEQERDLDALILLPAQLDRFIRLPGPAIRFVLLEQLVLLFLDRLFPPPFKLTGHGVFRILRDSEM